MPVCLSLYYIVTYVALNLAPILFVDPFHVIMIRATVNMVEDNEMPLF
jgi:hypothetical protein